MFKKYIKFLFNLLFVLVVPVITYFSFTFWSDILSEVFRPSKDNIIYIWDNKNDVWHTLIRESTSFSRSSWFYQNAPLLVKVVKMALKITVVLSVTMVIFYGVKYMIQVMNWNDLKSAGAVKDLKNLFIWLLIALFSITAVNLVISIPKSSMTTGDDLNAFEVWCRINWEVYWWLDFRHYVCNNSSLGYSDDPSTRDWQYIRARSNWSSHMDDRALWAYRCKVIVDINNYDSWKRIRIKNNMVESACTQLWWQVVWGS